MISKKISNIVYWLIRNGAIDEQEYELYEYAIYCLLLLCAPMIMAVVFGIIMNETLKGVIMIIPFMMIRKYSGGYHAKSIRVCLTISSILMCTFFIILKNIQVSIALNVITCFSALIIAIFSPIDSENRRLEDTEVKRFNKISIIITFFVLLIYWLIQLTTWRDYSVCFGLSLILTAILMMPCINKKARKMSFRS
ncbi:MAG: accessory gene regulator B family protein [Lachnospiraceae bacterium]|nr:accessory gene regulator B family protein [Lachnospiraceae bacterium]